MHAARQAQSSEPILFPKLRIRFADFPYLHFSNDQRLFTLETCCGYGYDLARESFSLTWIFKGRPKCTGHRKSRGALRKLNPYLRANRFQGLTFLTRKDNSSQDFERRLQARLRYRLCDRNHISPCLGSGILTRFPFGAFLWKISCEKIQDFQTAFAAPLRID